MIRKIENLSKKQENKHEKEKYSFNSSCIGADITCRHDDDCNVWSRKQCCSAQT
jgi:hypothetical protein